MAAALADVRKGTDDGAVLQHGNTLVLRFSIADPTKAGLVNSVLGSIVQDANQAASGQPARFTLAASQVEDKSLKPIQYFTPGLLGWALASGAAFGAAISWSAGGRTSCSAGCGWPRSASARSWGPGSGSRSRSG